MTANATPETMETFNLATGDGGTSTPSDYSRKLTRDASGAVNVAEAVAAGELFEAAARYISNLADTAAELASGVYGSGSERDDKAAWLIAEAATFGALFNLTGPGEVERR